MVWSIRRMHMRTQSYTNYPLDQFLRVNKNPEYAKIIEDMQLAGKKINDVGQSGSISSDELTRLFDMEKESSRFTVY